MRRIALLLPLALAAPLPAAELSPAAPIPVKVEGYLQPTPEKAYADAVEVAATHLRVVLENRTPPVANGWTPDELRRRFIDATQQPPAELKWLPDPGVTMYRQRLEFEVPADAVRQLRAKNRVTVGAIGVAVVFAAAVSGLALWRLNEWTLGLWGGWLRAGAAVVALAIAALAYFFG